MKFKCYDELPVDDGSFMTDMGYLDFHINDFGMQTGSSWTIVNMLIPMYPKWWDTKQPDFDKFKTSNNEQCKGRFQSEIDC